MDIAIISVTNQGKEISDKLFENLVKNPLFIRVDQYHQNVMETVKNIFDKYDCIIGIMASGIIVRSIAPYVNSKLSDPAVLIIDDNANHVISLLSGHYGKANDLTVKIASLLNSDPVITTSTDVNRKTGIDVIASRYYFKLENPGNIKYINRALVKSQKVDLYLPEKYSYIINSQMESSYNIHIDNNLESIIATIGGHEVILKPRSIVMGIGARRDIARSKVEHAIITACEILEIPVERVDLFATAEVKANEDGILYNAQKYSKELKIVPMDGIKSFNDSQIQKSDFVMKQFGVKGVCEPACLIINGKDSRLIFKKTAFDGVTIALSVGT